MSLADLERRVGRRFARFATNVSVARPRLWGGFRWLMRRQFDRLAPEWQGMRRPDAFAALEVALSAIETPPDRVLDLGTGTGSAAFIVANRFPEAEVVGVDIAEGMLDEARSNTPPELAERVRFETADGSELPFADGSFDLAVLANMIPFFDELARVVAPRRVRRLLVLRRPGDADLGAPERLRRELAARGFSEFADFAAAGGTALLARKDAAD